MCYDAAMTSNSKKDEFRERKERVLHTRVPEILEKELKRLSESLRLPVSNIVRAVLEDALEAAEHAGRTVQEEAWNVAERISWLNRYYNRVADVEITPSESAQVDQSNFETTDAQKPEEAQREIVFRGIVGFQPLIMARETQCSVCGRPIAFGEQGFVGVRDRRGPQVIVGEECLPKKVQY
jgi:hypothetical protein